MAKQDVLDAINATIIENGQKGITADSLRNLLTMMAENAGEGGGSGDGALRVIVPGLIEFGGEIVGAGELSPSSWAAMRPELETSLGLDLSEYEEVVNASFAHNANVAQQILAKAKVGEGVSVVLDQTPYMPTTLSIQLQMTPELAALYGDFAMCVVQPAALEMEYVKLTPEGEAVTGMVGEQLMCSLNPLAPPTLTEYSILYPSNMLIALNLDGSLTFTPIEEEQPSSGSGVVTFYTTVDGGELSEEYKAKNADAYSSYKNGMMLTICFIAEGAVQSTVYPMNSGLLGENVFASIWTYIDGNPGTMTFTCTQDGSATIQQ